MDEFSPEFFAVLRRLAVQLRACADALQELGVALDTALTVPLSDLSRASAQRAGEFEQAFQSIKIDEPPVLLTSTPGEGILNADVMRALGADPFAEFHGFDRAILDTHERAMKLGRELAREIRRRPKDTDPA